MGENWARYIRGGEGLKIEFKRQCPKLLRLAKTFSAFSNSAGGHMFFGLEDDGSYLGLEHLDGTRENVERVSQFHCDPPVNCEIHEWEPLPAIRILVVHIPEAQEKPVYAVNPQQHDDRWPFFRSDKENLPLDKKSLKTMRRLSSVSFDPEMLEGMDKHTRMILDRLNIQPRMTLAQVAKVGNISSHRAKKILVGLEHQGWVHSFFNEKRREFSLAIPWKKR